ncbi:MAG: nitrogen fixation protein NifE [Clostridiales bacterium]|nr:nitrogen fixation protein NifE [Clostridiales bacterium]
MPVITKNRELRPHTYTGGAGNSSEMENKFKEGCMKNSERTFEQALQCQQQNSLSCLISMEDAAFVIHSPLGCAGCVATVNESYKVGQHYAGKEVLKNAHYVVTNLDQKDVILGGEKKLRKGITDVYNRYHPKMIFIFTSCASGIIGEDIDAVAETMQAEIDAIIVPVHCEGFRSRIMSTGFDAVFNALSEYVLKDEHPVTDQHLINVFASTYIGVPDQREIARILAALDLVPNFIPFYSNYEKIKKIPTAIASVSLCHVFADNFMQWLNDQYGIPFSVTGMPLGTKNTDDWLRGVALLVGKEKEAEEFIESEHQRISEDLGVLKEKLGGKRAFICAGSGRSMATARLIEDFEMKLVGIQTPHYDEVVAPKIGRLIEEYGEDFVVDIASLQPFEQANLIRRLKPDVFIGLANWASRQGVATTHVLDSKHITLGYTGLVYLGNKINDAISNNGLNQKLAKHRPLHYKESWYEQNPFQYLV